MDVTVTSPNELASVARHILQVVSAKHDGAAVLALYGELGAGKTAFVQVLADELGVDGPVTSPTFVIEKKYDTTDERFMRLVHIDAYRLESADDLRKLDWDNIVADRDNIIAIEWAGRVADALPVDALKMEFETVDESTRTISY